MSIRILSHVRRYDVKLRAKCYPPAQERHSKFEAASKILRLHDIFTATGDSSKASCSTQSIPLQITATPKLEFPIRPPIACKSGVEEDASKAQQAS